MTNNTSIFLELVDEVMKENKDYFSDLSQKKEGNLQHLKERIFNDLQLTYNETSINTDEPFKELIKNYILSEKDNFSIDTKILKNISTQLEIEYLLGRRTKVDVQSYCFISDALVSYGIHRENKIVSFQCADFWKGLIKMIYLLNLMNHNQYSVRCDENAYKHPDFKKLPRLADAIKNIEQKLKEKIDLIDGVVVFREAQEERIVKKIENKLSRLHLFNCLRFIFKIYQEDKRKHNIEVTIPYKYIINILVKNISKSTHKCNDETKVTNTIDLLVSFITLYQLKEDSFEKFSLSAPDLVKRIKKQVLYSNFYPLYSLKTNTLIEYIESIVQPSIKEESFLNKFGFSIHNLINFFRLLDKQEDDIVSFNKDKIFKHEKKILDLFSVDANDVNKNYSTIRNLLKNFNLFTMNPILKYKNQYYVIGFKYFKMNFYNTLVEKIRKNIDADINGKIGSNVDLFVEKIFHKIQSKYGYEIFSGNYQPPKKENPESDLLLKLEKEIILIENKNKYLTNISFSGSESDILKDFVLSFVFSMKQLFKHEKNLKQYRTIKFKNNQRKLIYNNQNIVKISVSTNNWYSIMNNSTSHILSSIINLRFNIEDGKNYNNKDEFIKANKYLDALYDAIRELDNRKNSNMNVVLSQTLFLPLELIVDKYNDDDFLGNLKSLVGMKMNTDNILNIYDYYKYLKT